MFTPGIFVVGVFVVGVIVMCLLELCQKREREREKKSWLIRDLGQHVRGIDYAAVSARVV